MRATLRRVMSARLPMLALAALLVATVPRPASAGVPTASGAARAFAAAGTPPDLTGSWEPQSDPASPAWQLIAGGPGLTRLHASWHGYKTHSSLVGSFDGTLGQQNGAWVYSGTMTVEEGGLPPVTGTMSFTIVSENEFLLSYQQTNGPHAETQVFTRSSAPPSPTVPPTPPPHPKPVLHFTGITALTVSGQTTTRFSAGQSGYIRVQWSIAHLSGSATLAIQRHYLVPKDRGWKQLSASMQQVTAANGKGLQESPFFAPHSYHQMRVTAQIRFRGKWSQARAVTIQVR